MRITAPCGDILTSFCPGHHKVMGGAYSVDVGGQYGIAVGTPVRFNGSGSPEGVMAFVSDVGAACRPGRPYAGRIARAEVHEYVGAYGGWFRTGDIWYLHVEEIPYGWVGLGTQIGKVSGGMASECWSAPHVHVEWLSDPNNPFGDSSCLGSYPGAFPNLGDI